MKKWRREPEAVVSISHVSGHWPSWTSAESSGVEAVFESHWYPCTNRPEAFKDFHMPQLSIDIGNADC
jgi:hypothetical protein